MGGGGGGARFRILGESRGANSQQAHDVVMTSMRRNDVASTSFRRHVPNRFLINQCQIIVFLILKGWILCYTVDPPNLIPSNRQVIRRSKVSANHLIIRVIKYSRAETTARFRGPSGV